MERVPLDVIAGGCGGVLLGGDSRREVEGVSTDSRSVRPGDLFAAIRGENFDGHRFLSQAVQKGAVAAIVERDAEVSVPEDLPVIQVQATRPALGQLGGWWRNQVEAVCIAVAGSNGKTSTKDMLGSVLGQAGPVVRSPASFNNDLGVPLTLLQLKAGTRHAVLEVGTNHPGELKPLLNLIRPRHGILTSLGAEHLEFFGDLDGVFEEESAIGEVLPGDGFLVVPAALYRLVDLRARTRARLVTVGEGSDAEWKVTQVALTWEGTSFELEAPLEGYSGKYCVPLHGRHQAMNAVLAIALAGLMGIPSSAIRSGLACCVRPRMRLEPMEIEGIRILNDCYNANLDSMKSGLAVLMEMPGCNRRVALLGDMGELGASGEEMHRQLGRHVAQIKPELLICVGDQSKATADAARAAGLERVLHLDTVEQVGAKLMGLLEAGDLVLAKASRFLRLERGLDHFLQIRQGRASA